MSEVNYAHFTIIIVAMITFSQNTQSTFEELVQEFVGVVERIENIPNDEVHPVRYLHFGAICFIYFLLERISMSGKYCDSYSPMYTRPRREYAMWVTSESY